MNIGKKFFHTILVPVGMLFSMAQADVPGNSGFMTDYSQLEKVTDGTADYRFIAPGGEDKLARFDAVMIDQPEIFISPNSAYKGAKPDHMAALSESLRSGLVSALSGDMYVVNQPGENVFYISMAISNLELTKKKRGILGYTPAGFVVGEISGAASSNLAKKANLQSLVFELEGFDSVTGERVIALIDSVSGDKKNPASWEELEAFMARYGNIVRCRFDNARKPADKRVNCLASQ